MAPLPGLVKDPSPPANPTELSPITIPNGTILITTKQHNQIIDYLSGDGGPNFIPQLAIEDLVSDLAGKENSLGFTPEDAANKGAISGYAGLDSSQELLLTNFPTGSALQVLRRNAANIALEFTTPVVGLANIVEDTSPELGGELDALGNNIINIGATLEQEVTSGVMSSEMFLNLTGVDDTSIGSIKFISKSDGDTITEFALIEGRINLAEDGAEFGKLILSVIEDNSIIPYITLDADGGGIILGESLNMGGRSIQNSSAINFSNSDGDIGGNGTGFTLNVNSGDFISFGFNSTPQYFVGVNEFDFNAHNLINVGLLNLLNDNNTAVIELEANHTVPADGQIIGQIGFIDDDDLGARRTYTLIESEIDDPLNTSIDAVMKFSIVRANNLEEYIRLDFAGVTIGNTLLLGNNVLAGTGNWQAGTLELGNNDLLFVTASNPVHIVSALQDDDEYIITIPELFNDQGMVVTLEPQTLDQKTLTNVGSIGMASNNITDIGIIQFDDSNTFISQNGFQLNFDVATSGQFVFSINNTTSVTFGAASVNFIGNNATQVLELEGNHTIPADGQIIGQIGFIDDDDLGARRTYTLIESEIDDPLNTSIDAVMKFSIVRANNLEEYIRLDFTGVNIGNTLLLGNNVLAGTGNWSAGTLELGNNDLLFVTASNPVHIVSALQDDDEYIITIPELFNDQGMVVTLEPQTLDQKTLTNVAQIQLVPGQAITFDIDQNTLIKLQGVEDIDFQVTGVSIFGVQAEGIGVFATGRIELDGTATTGNTYIHEQSADDVEIVVGGEIGIKLEEIGTEVNVVIGANNILATTANDGFIYISSGAGPPTGTPTSYTGKIAMYYDSTNNALFLFNGAWRSVSVT